MSKPVTCVQFPSFRQELCWVKWGHWCEEWHLKVKNNNTQHNIFQEPGDIFSSDSKTKIRPELTKPPQSCPQVTDRSSCEEAGWVPGTTGPRCQQALCAETYCNLQQMPQSLGKAIPPKRQRRYTSGNNSHMLGDHVVLQRKDFRKATTARSGVQSHQVNEIKTTRVNAKLRWKETSHGNSNCSSCYHFVRLAALLIMYFSCNGRCAPGRALNYCYCSSKVVSFVSFQK